MEPDKIKALVRTRRISWGANTPRAFTFHPDGRYLYFLAADASEPLSDTPPSTLYAVSIPDPDIDTDTDIDTTTSAVVSLPPKVQWAPVLPQQRPHIASDTTTTDNETISRGDGDDETITNTTNPALAAAAAAQAKETELLRERKRTVAHGLTEFSIHSPTNQILLPLANALYIASCNTNTDNNNINNTTDTGDINDVVHPVLSPQPVGSSPALLSPAKDDNINDDTNNNTSTSTTSAPFLDPKLSPDGTMVAFVRDADIWVCYLESGVERRLTDSRPVCAPENTIIIKDDIDPVSLPTGPEGGTGEPRARSCGVAEYVMQEEFDRFTGFWWSPSCNNDNNDTSNYEILYLAVDQSQVPVVRVPHYSLDDAAEHYHYPRPGDANARTTPYVIPVPKNTITINARNIDDNKPTEARKYMEEHAWTPKVSIQEQYPWAEYVVRAGWLPCDYGYGSRAFWLALLDRSQMRMEVVAFPATGDGHGTVVLALRAHDWWINVDDNMRFLRQERALLYTSETRNGCAHIYYKRVPPLGEQLGGPPSPPSNSNNNNDTAEAQKKNNNNILAVTSHDDSQDGNSDDNEWIVESIAHVDEDRKLVYYSATKSGPLERQLCASSYDTDDICAGATTKAHKNVRPLSEPGFMITNVRIDGRHNRVVFNASNTISDVKSQVFKIDGLVEVSANGGTTSTSTSSTRAGQKLDTISLVPLVTIENPKMHPSNLPPWSFVAPELFSFSAEDGTTLHGAVYLPHSVGARKLADVKGPFPTVLVVYGGPQVQLVCNERRQTTAYKSQMLASMGYAVVKIDGRGSARRGLRFESVFKGKFGGAELRDQVAGIEELISKGIVDREKIAVTGWSYGAYAGAMLLARYSHLFKIAICGAPVTRWEGYDAAYTERYLGLPDENAAGYAASSVVAYAEAFPKENGRLMLVHSLMDENVHASHTVALVDELIKRNKQHTLLLFPRERHGLRDPAAERHFETAFFNYLAANM